MNAGRKKLEQDVARFLANGGAIHWFPIIQRGPETAMRAVIDRESKKMKNSHLFPADNPRRVRVREEAPDEAGADGDA